MPRFKIKEDIALDNRTNDQVIGDITNNDEIGQNTIKYDIMNVHKNSVEMNSTEDGAMCVVETIKELTDVVSSCGLKVDGILQNQNEQYGEEKKNIDTAEKHLKHASILLKSLKKNI